MDVLSLPLPILMIDWNLFTARERMMYSLAKEQSCLCRKLQRSINRTKYWDRNDEGGKLVRN